MRFKGQLLLPSESGPGLQVDLDVGEHRLAVLSDQGTLGDWPLDTVQIHRIGGDVFAMTVADEDLHFVADDTLTFAYTGLAAIKQSNGPSSRRSPWRLLAELFHVPQSPSDGPDTKTPPPRGVPESPREGQAAHSAENVSRSGSLDDDPPDLEGSVAGRSLPGPTPMSPETEWTPTRDDDAPTDMQTMPPPVIGQRTGTTSALEDETAMGWEDDDSPTEVLGGLEPSEAGPSPGSLHPIRCPALRHDGEPCRSPVIGPSGYCHPHDPNAAFRQDYRKALEARARLKRKGTARLTKVYGRLDRALKQVERGELAPDKAMAMAQLARTMCAILDLDQTPADPDDGPMPRP